MEQSNPIRGAFNAIAYTVMIAVIVVAWAYVTGIVVGFAIEAFSAGFSLSQ
jgi:hypothetical protein